MEKEEYFVYETLFASDELTGIPSGDVTLEPLTKPEQADLNLWGGTERELIEDFNQRNNGEYRLKRFDMGDGPRIIIRGVNDESDSTFSSGRTWVSRVGFKDDMTRAMVYVQHVATPESGIAYFVLLANEKYGWEIIGSSVAKIF